MAGIGVILIAGGFYIYIVAILLFVLGMSRGRGTIRLSRTGAWGKGSFLTQLLAVGTFLILLGSVLEMI